MDFLGNAIKKKFIKINADLEEAKRTRKDISANLKRKDLKGWTVLHHAADYNCNSALITKLVEAGADLHATDKNGNTPLHIAAASANSLFPIIDRLVAHGANPNVQNLAGQTPLELLLATPTIKDQFASPTSKIFALLTKGATVTVNSTQWKYLLYLTLEHKDIQAFKTLVSQPGADVNIINEANISPLLAAIQKPWAECIPLLLEHSAAIPSYVYNTDTAPAISSTMLSMFRNHSHKILQQTKLKSVSDIKGRSLLKPASVEETLKRHTFFEEDTTESRIAIGSMYASLINFHDNFLDLIMTTAALLALSGMDFYVAQGSNIFSLYPVPSCHKIAGQYDRHFNSLLFAIPDDHEEMARTWVHEVTHAILNQIDSKFAHNCKPYPHGDKVKKAAYIEAVRSSQSFTEEMLSPSEDMLRLKKLVFTEVDNDLSTYNTRSKKLQEYLARAMEAYVTSLQSPDDRKDILQNFSPLFDFIAENIIPPLKAFAFAHPYINRIILPQSLQPAVPPLYLASPARACHDDLLASAKTSVAARLPSPSRDSSAYKTGYATIIQPIGDSRINERKLSSDTIYL